jgi:hypothetical protein
MTNTAKFKGPSPIQLAKEATPFWFESSHYCDSLELAAIASFEDSVPSECTR